MITVNFGCFHCMASSPDILFKKKWYHSSSFRSDYKPPIPKNANITYEIEILSITRGKTMMEMTMDECILHRYYTKINSPRIFAKNNNLRRFDECFQSFLSNNWLSSRNFSDEGIKFIMKEGNTVSEYKNVCHYVHTTKKLNFWSLELSFNYYYIIKNIQVFLWKIMMSKILYTLQIWHEQNLLIKFVSFDNDWIVNRFIILISFFYVLVIKRDQGGTIYIHVAIMLEL